MTPDERLTLAAELYARCRTGADIGTDHAYLPCYLLQQGICKRMLLCDVSTGALRNAAETVERYHLQDRTRLLLADGLSALDEECGCISITGMGGETIAKILLNGREKLRGAVLVLSAHTEQAMVRRAVQEIGYHLTAERICRAAGRMYLMWRAEPGVTVSAQDELDFGSLMYQENDPLLIPWLQKRLSTAQKRMTGLTGAAGREAELSSAEHEVLFYQQRLKEAESRLKG